MLSNNQDEGVLPTDMDQDTDTGNADVEQSSPFDVIKGVLAYGRKKHKLPEQMFANATARPIPPKPGTVAPNPDRFDPRDFLPGGKGTKATDDPDADGGTDTGNAAPDEDTQMFATGGGVEGLDEETPEGGAGAPMGQAGGMMDDDAEHEANDRFPNLDNDQERNNRFQEREKKRIQDEDWGGKPSGRKPGPGSQNLMPYLSGQDAMHPQMADSLERRVDPSGQMDPNMRKIEAIKQAGDPEAQWALMQNYRKKFNAYNAFAQAAIQGAGGRGPNPASAADAATKAYQNLPDGKAMTFEPVQGGVRVRIQDLSGPDLMKALGAGRGGANGLPPQRYEEGGAVDPTEDEDDALTTGVLPDQQAAPPGDDPNVGASGQEQGPVQSALGGRRPDQALKDVILSIPQFLGFLKDKGQADSVLEKGPEKALAEAQAMQAQAPAGPMGPGAPGTFPQSAPQPQGPQQQQMDPRQRPTSFTDNPTQPGGSFQRTPAKVPEKENYTLKDVLHEIDQQYPMVGMSAQRADARREAIQKWMGDRTKVESEQMKGGNAMERAKITGGLRNEGVKINADQRATSGAAHDEAASGRLKYSADSKAGTADKNRDATTDRMRETEEGKNRRTAVVAKPGLLNDPKKMQDAATNMNTGRQQPQQQQQYPDAKPGQDDREPGIYKTPKGLLRWTGTGWAKP